MSAMCCNRYQRSCHAGVVHRSLFGPNTGAASASGYIHIEPSWESLSTRSPGTTWAPSQA